MPKKGISGGKQKIAVLRAIIVVTYQVKLFRTGADKHGILLSVLLVAEAISLKFFGI